MKIGVQELLIVLVIVNVIFGPTQIPKLAKMFGKASKKFKEGLEDEDEKEEKKSSVKKASADDDDEA